MITGAVIFLKTNLLIKLFELRYVCNLESSMELNILPRQLDIVIPLKLDGSVRSPFL